MPTSKLSGVAATATVGRFSVFKGKERSRAISFTCTVEHRAKLAAAMTRLGLSRADVLGILIERYADAMTREGFPTRPARSLLPVFDAFGRRPMLRSKHFADAADRAARS